MTRRDIFEKYCEELEAAERAARAENPNSWIRPADLPAMALIRHNLEQHLGKDGSEEPLNVDIASAMISVANDIFDRGMYDNRGPHDVYAALGWLYHVLAREVTQTSGEPLAETEWEPLLEENAALESTLRELGEELRTARKDLTESQKKLIELLEKRNRAPIVDLRNFMRNCRFFSGNLSSNRVLNASADGNTIQLEGLDAIVRELGEAISSMWSAARDSDLPERLRERLADIARQARDHLDAVGRRVKETFDHNLPTPPPLEGADTIFPSAAMGSSESLSFPVPEMVPIPASSFLMGTPDKTSKEDRKLFDSFATSIECRHADERPLTDDDIEAIWASLPEGVMSERPLHRVDIPRPFEMGRYPVTFEEYEAFAADMDWLAHNGIEISELDDNGWGRGRRPVINVTWTDAHAYCKWLSDKKGADYHLPSEAEWEYACRAGTLTAYWWGNDWDPAKANANRDIGETTEVGRFPENPLGLCDMHGNVCEWVEDGWHDSYANDGRPDNGDVWSIDGDDSARVLRGGSWIFGPRFERSADRGRPDPASRIDNIGFRVSKTLPR